MIGAVITRANQKINAEYAEAMQALNTSHRQVLVLSTIRDSKKPPSQTDLVRLTGIDRSTVADIIKRVVASGWAARKRTKDDHRSYEVKVTSAGSKMLTKAMRAIDKIDAKLIDTYKFGPTVDALHVFATQP
jgi:MarR family transcriptional regulator, temperature-dependent positive regulator of motility